MKVCGFEFESDVDLSTQLGKRVDYVHDYRQHGYSYEEIIEGTLKRAKRQQFYGNSEKYFNKTVLGYSFRNDEDLSKQLGKSGTYVSKLKQEGLSYQEIILKATKSQTVKGYTFKTDRDLSRQLGRFEGYVSYCKGLGLSYEEIIDRATRVLPDFSVKTVLGYSFKTDSGLSSQLNKASNYVYSLRKEGLSYEEIILRANSEKSKTIKGYTFINDKDLSRQLGRFEGYVSKLRRQGMSYEEIINGATKDNYKYDILGYKFNKDVELSRKLNKPKDYVSFYKSQGLSYEEIIKKASEAECIMGYKFSSNEELEKLLGKREGYVQHRLGKGMSYEDIIFEAITRKIGEDTYEFID